MRSVIVSLNQFQKRLSFYGFGGLNSILRNKLFLFWSESLRLSTRLKSKLSRMWMVLWCLDIYSVWIKSFLVSPMAFWHHFQKEVYFCGADYHWVLISESGSICFAAKDFMVCWYRNEKQVIFDFEGYHGILRPKS